MAANILPKCPQEAIICISIFSWYQGAKPCRRTAAHLPNTRNTKPRVEDYTRSINTKERHDFDRIQRAKNRSTKAVDEMKTNLLK